MLKRPIYHGWFLLGAAMLIYVLVIGTTMSAFSLYVKPVEAEFGLSRATVNTGLILINVGMAIWGVFVGRLLDRLPLRPIMMGSGALIGLCLIGLGLSRNVLLSGFIMLVPLAIGIVGGCTLSITVMLSRWFVANRGRALALSAIGMSAATITTVPLVALVIGTLGWRTALMGSGVLVGLALVVVGLIVRDRPGPDDVEPGLDRLKGRPGGPSASAGTTPLSVGQVLRIPAFWTIGIGVGMALSVAQAVMVSLVPFVTDGGLSLAEATSLLSVAGMAGIGGKLALATFADRVDRSVLLSICFMLLAGLNLLLMVKHEYGMMLAVCACLGAIMGGAAPTFYALVADRFGTVSLGTVRGLMAPLLAILAAVAIRFSGEVYDRTGNYQLMFLSFAGLTIIASLLMISDRFLRPPQVTETPAPVATGTA